MSRIELSGPDRKLVRETLQDAFEDDAMRTLVVETVGKKIAREVNWKLNETAVFASLMRIALGHGVLDRIVVAAAAERPHRPDLRALPLLLATRPGWSLKLAQTHGIARGGLEALTSKGQSFVDTSRLAHWLIGVERQVCQVECPPEHGTGFLIGPDLVLTCYHVVAGYIGGGVHADKVQVRFDYRRGPDGREPAESLPWVGIDGGWLPVDGAKGATIPHAPYSDADLSLQGQPAPSELDFALLKLATPVGSDAPEDEVTPRGWVDLSGDLGTPEREAPILIVQHPERKESPPPQQPLQIAFDEGAFVGLNANKTRVSYSVSTLPGSSGSPVFDGTLQPVALHHNRGQIRADAVDLYKTNRGIPLQAIRAAFPEGVRDSLSRPPGS